MSHSIHSILNFGIKRLKDCGVQNFNFEATFLLEEVLSVTREYLFLNKDKVVSTKNFNKFKTYITRRLDGEPIQYISKTAHFFSKKFHIMSGVLVPRPETEIIVEKVLSEISRQNLDNLTCMDMCAGTGCIGLTLCLETEKIKQMFLVDNYKKPEKCCLKNISSLNLSLKASYVSSDLFKSVTKIKFDYIISNPPYISNKDYGALNKDIMRFEQKSALIAGSEGLTFIKKISTEAGGYLKNGGHLFLEVGYNQGNKVKKLLESIGYKDVVSYNDLNGIQRVVKGKWKK